MTNLSVNVNKVALVRNQRDAGYPDVRRAARMAVQAGAQGITVHPRPDGRHIRHDDVAALGAAEAVSHGNSRPGSGPKGLNLLSAELN